MHTNRYYGFTGLSLRPAEAGDALASTATGTAPVEHAAHDDDRDDRALILEHVARPVGRHGRRLIEEIETYLAFFAIARG